MGDHNKDKTEKGDKTHDSGDKRAEGKSGTDFHEGSKFTASDAKAMFAHLTGGKSKTENGDGGGGQQKGGERAEKSGEKSVATLIEQFKPERNHKAIPDDTATRVAWEINNYPRGKVVNDRGWTDDHGGAINVGQYLYFEEGNSLTGAIYNGPPIRSGHELELYDKICKYVKNTDMTDPNNKITQAQIMRWSLDANFKDAYGTVSVQDSILTAHNVMRALARSDVSEYTRLPKNDPIRHIIEDQREDARHARVEGHAPGLGQIIREKYHVKSPMAGITTDLFDRNSAYSVFKPNSDDSNSSAGSGYHFWVGALAASSLTSPTARGMVWGEGSVVKGNNKTGQDEKPWGGAGIDTWDRTKF